MSESENPAIFLALLAFLALLDCFSSCICFVCFACAALVLCLCWLWLFFPSDDCDKKKGRTVLVLPLFVRGLFPLLLFGFNSQPFLYLVKIKAENIIQLGCAYPLRV